MIPQGEGKGLDHSALILDASCEAVPRLPTHQIWGFLQCSQV